jgi:PAS domain S-box-containing protein
MKLHDLSLATRVIIGVIAIVVTGTATLLYAENARLHDSYLSEQRAHLNNDLNANGLKISQTVNSLRQDLMFLSHTPPISGIMRASLNHGYDARDGDTREKWEKRLRGIFNAFSVAHPDYYKIRYIGVADGGQILAQTDKPDSHIDSQSPYPLEKIADEDFFKAALKLNQDQVWLSKIELVSDADNPAVPTLRAVTPAFTDSGEIFGVLVLSMNASSLLKSAVSDLPGTQTYMSNRDGQYLLHPDLRRAFKFEPGNTNKITTDFPLITSMLNLQTADYLPLQAATVNQDNSLLAAKRIHFDPGDPSRFMLLLYYLPSSVVTEQVTSIPTNALLYEFVVMLLVAGIATLLLRRTFSPLKQITVAADKIAAGEHDIMLPRNHGGEIGSLTTAINAMLSKLAQREAKQQQLSAQIHRYADEVADLYEHAPCGYHSLDKDGVFQRMNATELKWLGYTKDEIVGKRKLADLLTPDAFVKFQQNFPHFKKTGELHDLEMDLICKDGAVLPVMINASAIRDPEGNFIASRTTVYDITERKKMDQERFAFLKRLEETARNLVASQETARRRLSSELHDRTSPNLAAISINLNIIASELSQQHATEISERLEDTSALIADTTTSIREICADMRPPLLDYAGLTATLESYVQQFERRTGIKVQFNCVKREARYTPELESLLFRIFQEAMTNCAKHAHATLVIVTLSNDDYPIALNITDDGIGFDLAQLGKDGVIGFGVLNMREMTEVAGGKFSIESAPGYGTRIAVENLF